MRRIATNGSGPKRGYSLVEMIVVLAIVTVLSAAAIVRVLGTLKADAAITAAQMIGEQMREARQSAVSDRKVYLLTFTAPGTIAVAVVNADGTTTAISSVNIPTTVTFHCESGIPTTSATTPDGFGLGVTAIDFNGSNVIYFQPDGAGRDALGRICNGVIYVSIPGQVATAHAVDLFGSTGRIKSWSIYQKAGAWSWR